MVSIFCMVYNHETFLRKCLDGFLMQQCNFNYTIVIGEDCSTDNSRAIILEYAKNYPGKFKLLLHEKNVGAAQNQKLVFENCTGKYIALCEGDDYWTDPLKLQKQVDFLEDNLDFGMVYAKAKVYSETTKTIINETGGPVNSFHDLLEYNPIPTLTVMLKKDVYDLVKNKIHDKDSPLGDLPVWLYMSCQGKIGFIDEITAVYRILPESASQSSDVGKQIRFLEATHKIRISFLESIDAKEYFFKVDRMHYIKISQLRLLPTYKNISKTCIQYFRTNNLKSYYIIEELKCLFMFSNPLLNIIYKNSQFLVRVLNKIIQ